MYFHEMEPDSVDMFHAQGLNDGATTTTTPDINDRIEELGKDAIRFQQAMRGYVNCSQAGPAAGGWEGWHQHKRIAAPVTDITDKCGHQRWACNRLWGIWPKNRKAKTKAEKQRDPPGSVGKKDTIHFQKSYEAEKAFMDMIACQGHSLHFRGELIMGITALLIEGPENLRLHEYMPFWMHKQMNIDKNHDYYWHKESNPKMEEFTQFYPLARDPPDFQDQYMQEFVEGQVGIDRVVKCEPEESKKTIIMNDKQEKSRETGFKALQELTPEDVPRCQVKIGDRLRTIATDAFPELERMWDFEHGAMVHDRRVPHGSYLGAIAVIKACKIEGQHMIVALCPEEIRKERWGPYTRQDQDNAFVWYPVKIGDVNFVQIIQETSEYVPSFYHKAEVREAVYDNRAEYFTWIENEILERRRPTASWETEEEVDEALQPLRDEFASLKNKIKVEVKETAWCERCGKHYAWIESVSCPECRRDYNAIGTFIFHLTTIVKRKKSSCVRGNKKSRWLKSESEICKGKSLKQEVLKQKMQESQPPVHQDQLYRIRCEISSKEQEGLSVTGADLQQ